MELHKCTVLGDRWDYYETKEVPEGTTLIQVAVIEDYDGHSLYVRYLDGDDEQLAPPVASK